MTTLKRAAYNTVILYIGKLVGILISTITLAITTRYLGVAGFGDYSAVLSFAAVMVSLTDLGLTWIISRELAQGNEKILNAFTNFKFAFTAITLTVAALILPLIGYNTNVEKGIWIAILYIFFTSINNLQIAILQGKSSLDKTAYTDISSRFVNLIALWIIIKLDAGYYAVVAALNLAGLTTYAVNNYFIRKFKLPKYQIGFEGIRGYKQEIIQMALLSSIAFLVYKTDTLILARLKPSVDVGIYGAAYRILDVAMAIPSIFIGALYPVLSIAQVHEDATERKKTFHIGFLAVMVMASITAGLGILLAPFAINLLAGKEFAATATESWRGTPITSTIVFQILSVFLFTAFFTSYFNALLIITKRQKACIIANGLGLVFNLVANILLIPQFSYLACAVLTVITQLIVAVPMLWQLWKDQVPLGGIMDVGRVAFATIVALMLAYLWQGSFILSLIVFTLVWLALAWTLGGEPRRLVEKGWEYFSRIAMH